MPTNLHESALIFFAHCTKENHVRRNQVIYPSGDQPDGSFVCIRENSWEKTTCPLICTNSHEFYHSLKKQKENSMHQCFIRPAISRADHSCAFVKIRGGKKLPTNLHESSLIVKLQASSIASYWRFRNLSVRQLTSCSRKDN